MARILFGNKKIKLDKQAIQRNVDRIRDGLVRVVGDKYYGQVCSIIDDLRLVILKNDQKEMDLGSALMTISAFDGSEFGAQARKDMGDCMDLYNFVLPLAFIDSGSDLGLHVWVHPNNSALHQMYAFVQDTGSGLTMIHEIVHSVSSRLLAKSDGSYTFKGGFVLEKDEPMTALNEAFTQFLALKVEEAIEGEPVGHPRAEYWYSDPGALLLKDFFEGHFDAVLAAYLEESIKPLVDLLGEKTLDALVKVVYDLEKSPLNDETKYEMVSRFIKHDLTPVREPKNAQEMNEILQYQSLMDQARAIVGSTSTEKKDK